jgi:hypothetical protein
MVNDRAYRTFKFICSCMLCWESLRLYIICWWSLHDSELHISIWHDILSITRWVRMKWLHKTSSWSRLIYMETRAWSMKVYSFAQWNGCKRESYALRCGMCNEIGYNRKTCHIQQYMYDKKKVKIYYGIFH